MDNSFKTIKEKEILETLEQDLNQTLISVIWCMCTSLICDSGLTTSIT